MKGAIALLLLGVAASSPVPQPQLGALKSLLESLSGDDSPGEVNGDYQQVPYETIQKINGYEERRYPSVKWACTEATYDIEEDDEEEGDGSDEWSIMKMMQRMTNKKSWKKKPENQMFMKLFRYISGVNKERQEIEMTVPVLSKMTPMDGKMNKQMCFYLTKEAQKNPPQPEDPAVKIEENKEMVVFVKQFGGYAMQDSTWAKEALKFSEELADRADEVEFAPYFTAGYDSPMKFWNRKNEVMFLKKSGADTDATQTNV
eukprot:TRINITY_DN655_c1_g1_i3.p1 TRINITY_DN655_c1_g1~~TRINITY_DN655_c1_g1_i3.p1  ORF type:complete len:259 (-),score=99.82 TRINITY_DN655_c1_g1_i3:53-829(-)